MAPVDTHYSALPVSLSDRPSVALDRLSGGSMQAGQAGDKSNAGIDWFSSVQAVEYQPITLRTNATADTTLDALTSNILSHVSEYTPD